MGQISEQLAREIAASGVRRAVETGTFKGDSAVLLGGIFRRVETIELSRKYALRAWLRLLPRRNVRVRCGDSTRLLRPSREPTLYWLDGHWSGGDTAGAEHECPLLDEIRETSPGTVGDWYLIDDARMFTNTPPPPHDPEKWPTLEQIQGLVARQVSASPTRTCESLHQLSRWRLEGQTRRRRWWALVGETE